MLERLALVIWFLGKSAAFILGGLGFFIALTGGGEGLGFSLALLLLAGAVFVVTAFLVWLLDP